MSLIRSHEILLTNVPLGAELTVEPPFNGVELQLIRSQALESKVSFIMDALQKTPSVLYTTHLGSRAGAINVAHDAAQCLLRAMERSGIPAQISVAELA